MFAYQLQLSYALSESEIIVWPYRSVGFGLGHIADADSKTPSPCDHVRVRDQIYFRAVTYKYGMVVRNNGLTPNTDNTFIL